MRWSVAGTLGLAVALGACSFDQGGVAPDAGDPDADTDGDGVLDVDDNCRTDDNEDQRDEDGDGVGNVCDNCPGVANEAQADDGETDAGRTADGAGDACDPQPDQGGNTLMLFEGFDDPAVFDAWSPVGQGTWAVSDGALRQTSTTNAGTLALTGSSFGSLELQAKITIDTVPASTGPTDTSRAFGAIVAHGSSSGVSSGFLCVAYYNPASVATTGLFQIITLRGDNPIVNEATVPMNANITQGGVYDFRERLHTGSGDITCGLASSALPATVTVSGTSQAYDQGELALHFQYVALHVDYLALFAMPDAP